MGEGGRLNGLLCVWDGGGRLNSFRNSYIVNDIKVSDDCNKTIHSMIFPHIFKWYENFAYLVVLNIYLFLLPLHFLISFLNQRPPLICKWNL